MHTHYCFAVPLVPIDSVGDERIEVFRGLRDHAARQVRELPGGDMAGVFIAEGVRVIERALAARQKLTSILIDSRRTGSLSNSLVESVAVFAATEPVLAEITGRPELRDPLACFVRPPSIEAAELIGTHSTFAVLEGVNNPNNLGVIMRNAAALGVGAVLLDPTCGDPLYRRAIRASMGQIFAVAHTRIDSLPGGLGPLHDAGVATIALSPSAPDTLRRPATTGKLAVILGAEGPGLTAATLSAATHRMRIPMTPGIDSLNVASAAAIAFHLIGTQR